MQTSSKSSILAHRHACIRKVIQEFAIESQEQLAHVLGERFSLDVDQSTLSRDLKALGAFKGGSGNLYRLPDRKPKDEMLVMAVLSVSKNEAQIVVKTLAGLAGFVADWLESQAGQLGILGIIADDSTLFIAPNSVRSIELTKKRIEQAFGMQEKVVLEFCLDK